jgi:hypothetical protein
MDIKSSNFNFLAKLDPALMNQSPFAERLIFKPQGQNFWPAQTIIERHRKLVYRK